jgi:hypothetical protein
MIRQETVNQIEKIGGGESHKFSIKVSRAAFSILSGLYSDTRKAIVRELSTNAMDSHVAAGKPTLPIHVHLPNALEPYLTIRDFGLGLSHEDVIKIYSTYFESTKTSSNDFNGCLGLGSKSPFAYTDNFTVTSIHDGVKRFYLAFFDESGAPTITLGGEEKTTESNGVEIQIPVKQGDSDKFIIAAKEVYRWFSVKPEIVGAAISFDAETEPLIKGQDWKLTATSLDHYSSEKSFVVMGGVAYPIRSSSVQNGFFDDLLRAGLIIQTKIGEVDFTPSREDLDYNERTVAFLTRRMTAIKDEISQVYKTQLDACTFSDEKILLFRALPRFVQSVVKVPFVIKSDGVRADLASIRLQNQEVRSFSHKSYGVNPFRQTNSCYFDYRGDTIWVCEKNGDLPRAKHWSKENKFKGFLAVDSGTRDTLVKEYGFNPAIFQDPATINYVRPVSGGKNNIPYASVSPFDNGRSGDSFTSVPLVDAVSNGATHYALKVEGSRTHCLIMGRPLARNQVSRLLDKPEKVVAIAATKEKLARKAGLKPVSELIETEIKKVYSSQDFANFIFLKDKIGDKFDRHGESVIQVWKKACNGKKFNSNLFKTLELIENFRELSDKFSRTVSARVCQVFQDQVSDSIKKMRPTPSIVEPEISRIEASFICLMFASYEYSYNRPAMKTNKEAYLEMEQISPSFSKLEQKPFSVWAKGE